jgi:diketogulonate reductase-like aldo/keto reductase
MINRRQVLQLSAALVAQQLAQQSLRVSASETPPAATGTLIQRPIPSSGELIPVMGMGTSRTFDAGTDDQTMKELSAVMQALLDGGGTVIDSSPMYGNAETRVGDVLRSMAKQPPVFAATKVWTQGEYSGIEQMEGSAQRMNVEQLSLIAIHNLKDWKTHLKTLKRWKAEGKVRYIGLTTSHGRKHDQVLEIMENEPLDFVQFSYNIEDRTAEKLLLPIALERGIATMINRPFQRGSLFRKSNNVALPSLAAELDCTSWAQFYLKYILAHPAVTCIIPATSKVHHMTDNMQANFGRVPDVIHRREMRRIFDSL